MSAVFPEVSCLGYVRGRQLEDSDVSLSITCGGLEGALCMFRGDTTRGLSCAEHRGEAN
jgi:hypothetical protein